MHKFLKIFLILIGVISAILWYFLPPKDMPATEAAASGAMNGMFWITYLLLAVAVIFALLFTLINLFSNPKGLKKTLFVIGGFLLVVVISYVLADGTDVSIEEMAQRGVETSETTIKRIGMGLNVFFILTAIAILLMVVPGIKKLFGK